MTLHAGPRLAPALAGAAALAAAGALWPPLVWVALGVVVGLAGCAIGEGLWLARIPIRVERPDLVALSLGESEELAVRLSHQRPATLRLRVRLRLPDELGGGSIAREAVVPAGEVVPLAFGVSATARGRASMPPVAVAFHRWGLANRLVQVDAPQTVRVLPNLRAVARLDHQLNALFLRGLGTRLAPRVGQGREFDRLREYVAGDDFRRIAWKASARQRKLIVREFRVERSQDVLLCIDRGHRMAARVGPLTRADHAVNAALLTAYVCNRAEDRVGALSFAADVERGVLQGRGADQLRALTDFTTGIRPQFLASDYRALAAHLRGRLRARTLVLLLTMLPERNQHGDLIAATRALLPRHLPLVVVLRDAALEAAANAMPDDRASLARTLVASELVQDRSRLVRELRACGALVVESLPEDAGVSAINAYLDVKRRQLL